MYSNSTMIIATRFFFFQAEDGIRDVAVTGVQTCALPIYLRREQARRRRVVEVARRRRGRPVVTGRRLADEVHDPLESRGPEDRVHLRHRSHDLAAVALSEAARDDERAAAPRLLEPRQLEDRVHRLLARTVDEGARVDDEALGLLGLGREGEAGLGEHAEHQLGVDLVLGAAEGREMDLHVGGPVYPGSSEGASTAPSFTDSPRTRLARGSAGRSSAPPPPPPPRPGCPQPPPH